MAEPARKSARTLASGDAPALKCDPPDAPQHEAEWFHEFLYRLGTSSIAVFSSIIVAFFLGVATNWLFTPVVLILQASTIFVLVLLGEQLRASVFELAKELGDEEMPGPHLAAPFASMESDLPAQDRAMLALARRHSGRRRLALLGEEVTNRIAAAILLLLLAPAMATIALMIKLSSSGPVLIRHERVGLLGKRFEVFKFRTVFVGREQPYTERMRRLMEDPPVDGAVRIYRLLDDPSLTAVGKMLRSSGMDELPVLVNICRGDMNFVGPRPPRSYHEWDVYEDWQRTRMLVKPGLMGLAQLAGGQLSFEDMVRLDLLYLAKRSLWLDLVIITRTIPIILSNQRRHWISWPV